MEFSIEASAIRVKISPDIKQEKKNKISERFGLGSCYQN